MFPAIVASRPFGFVTPYSGLFDGSTGYLSRTFSGDDGDTWSLSLWMKRASDGTMGIFGRAGDNAAFAFNTNGSIFFNDDGAATRFADEALRDPTAWVHILATGNGTANKVYINGVQLTFATSANVGNLNTAVAHYIGNAAAYGVGDFYLAHVAFCSTTEYAPTDFAKADGGGNWVPKDLSGLTWGTNGAWIKDPSTGVDSSGNGNDWTVNGTITQVVDVPTDSAARNLGCAATWNPSDVGRSNGANDLAASVSMTTGNTALVFSTNTANWNHIRGTLGITGPTYFEFDASGSPTTSFIGVATPSLPTTSSAWQGQSSGWFFSTGLAQKFNGSGAAYGSAASRVMVAVDPANGKIWWGDASTDTWFASGDPAAGTNAAFTNLPALVMIAASLSYAATYTLYCRPGDFVGTVPAGFKALGTQNLSTGQAVTSGAGDEQQFVYTGGTPTQVVWGGTTYNPGDAGIDFYAFGFKITTGTATGVSWTATVDPDAGVAGVAQPRAQLN